MSVRRRRRIVGQPPRYPSPIQGEERASVTDGTVIIIGGAEDKIRDRVILNRFVALAGGWDATIVVISTASSLGTEAGERYRQIFGDLGVQTVRPLHATTRPQANDETAALALRDATGVFLTGGNQLKLASTIGGTRLADAMLERFQHGAVMAGTSAGASNASGGGSTASGPIAAAGGRRRRVREASEDGPGGDDGARESPKLADAGGDCSITINSVPWSEVWIDGKNTTKHTPFVDYKLPCGKHKLAFKRADMQIDHSESITVKAGQAFKQRYTLETNE
jgi:hypothetical protein